MVDDGLAGTLAGIGDILAPGFEPADVGRVLTARSGALLTAESAVMFLDGKDGSPRLVSASDSAVRAAQLTQLRTRSGPAFDALRAGEVVRWPDLRDPGVPWPGFAGVAARLGLRSVDSVPLRVRDRKFGVWCLFRREPDGLPAAKIRIAVTVARFAAVGLLQDRRRYQVAVRSRGLQTQLDRMVLVEQAVGILAERWHTSIPVARENLLAASRSRGQSVPQVAVAVVASVSYGDHR